METQLIHAIRGRLVVEFDYKDLHRVVNPHLLGDAQKGVALSGYQTAGQSSRGSLPVWSFCYLDDIKNLLVTDRTFTPQAEFNVDDKKFQSVIASVDGP